MVLSNLEKELLAYCTEDHMGLWVIVTRVFGDGYTRDKVLPEWVRQQTLDVLSDLLSKGLIIVGQMNYKDNRYEFAPFLFSDDEVIRKIEDEWNRLGRAPNIGDTFWITASDAGERLAKELGFET